MVDDKRKKIVSLMILSLVCFVIGASSGWLVRKHQEVTPTVVVREKSSDYKFINPIMFLHVPEDESVPEFQILKKSVSKYVTDAINKKEAIDVSVYFRELDTNKWIGINADNKYSPASLFKVASMISFFRAAENNPELLTKSIHIDPKSLDLNADQDYYPSLNKTKVDHTYTTAELLSHMIVDSDNLANATINILIGDKILNNTYIDFRIPVADGKLSEDFVSVKMYSRLFRALYNGTYISRESSEKALGLLSKTTFDQGLVAGVDKGVQIAHKFGERTIKTTDNTVPETVTEVRELHDCGIVYAPQKHYFICVMTKGSDFVNLQKIISDISGIAWEKMKS